MNIPKKIHIACTTNESYVPYLGGMLSSLFDTNSNESFHIYILAQKLSEESQTAIMRFFEQQQQEFQFIWIDASQFDIAQSTINGHISIETYFRLLLAEVLPKKLERVLYLDVDILVRGNISKLWNADFEGKALVAIPDISSRFMPKHRASLGMKSTSLYFNAGVLLINLEVWRNKNIYSLASKIILQKTTLLRFWDQDVLNILWEGNVKWENSQWNYWGLSHGKNYYNKDVYSAKIIHFIGGQALKPWHIACTHPYAHLFRNHVRKSNLSLHNNDFIPASTSEKIRALLMSYMKKILIYSQVLRLISPSN